MKQKMYRTSLCLFAVLLALNFALAFSLPALAASQGNVNVLWGGSNIRDGIRDNSGLPSNGPESDPRTLVASVIKWALGFLGILSVIIILYAGFKWMLSGGSEEKVSESKKMLIAGVIGLVIILSAYILADFVLTKIYEAASGNSVV